MRRVRLKGSISGFIDVFGKEMKGSEVGKVRRVAEKKSCRINGMEGVLWVKGICIDWMQLERYVRMMRMRMRMIKIMRMMRMMRMRMIIMMRIFC